jgi:hypothetical protein
MQWFNPVYFAAQVLKAAHKIPVFPDRNRKEGENKWREIKQSGMECL